MEERGLASPSADSKLRITLRASNQTKPNVALILFVSLLAACSAYVSLMLLVPLVVSEGVLGISTDYDGSIKAIQVGSAAEAACWPTAGRSRTCLRVGDKVDFSCAPQPGDSKDYGHTCFAERMYVVPTKIPIRPGVAVNVRISRDGVRRDVNLRSKTQELAFGDRLELIAQTIASLVFIAVGVILLLKSPGPATWGFFAYAIGSNPAVYVSWPSPYPSPLSAIVYDAVIDALNAVAIVGIVVFAVTFDGTMETKWRTRFCRALPALLIASLLLEVYIDIAPSLFGFGSAVQEKVMASIQIGMLLVATYGLTETYFRGATIFRAQIRWILLFFVFGVLANYVANLSIYSSLTIPEVATQVLLFLNVLLPLAVLHAVIYYRVLSVKIVLSRTLIYAAFSGVAYLSFSIANNVVSHYITKIATQKYGILIGLSLISGWLFSLLKKKVDPLLDSIVYRKRQGAIARLLECRHQLRTYVDASSVDAALVFDPVRELDLIAAALYYRDGVNFRLRTSVGLDNLKDSLAQADLDDDVYRTVVRDQTSADIFWPEDSTEPLLTLALPIGAGRDVDAIILYGRHTNGEDTDKTEVSALFDFVTAAARAYISISLDRLARTSGSIPSLPSAPTSTPQAS